MDFVKDAESVAYSVSTVSFPEAQRLISLFFALCTKVCLWFLFTNKFFDSVISLFFFWQL